MKSLACAIALLCLLSPAQAENTWSRIRQPSSTPSAVIGFYSAGCIAGAAELSLQGPGYQVMRASRNRHYGHPSLIDFIQRLGSRVAGYGDRLLIGDMAQPRGGPMAFGHASHQSGLDVDIWFTQEPRRTLTRQESEQLPMLSMVQPERAALHPQRWSPRYRNALALAATDPKVERIFVNPIIKLTLCRSEQDRSWLGKLRPWWGHDGHFHVRLRCPPDSPQCQAQQAPPPGDGCDDDLVRWVEEIQQAALYPPKPTPKQKKKKKQRELPPACNVVRNQIAVQ